RIWGPRGGWIVTTIDGCARVRFTVRRRRACLGSWRPLVWPDGVAPVHPFLPIAPRHRVLPLEAHSRLLHDARGGDVRRVALRRNALRPKRGERELDDGAERLRHESPAPPFATEAEAGAELAFPRVGPRRGANPNPANGTSILAHGDREVIG